MGQKKQAVKTGKNLLVEIGTEELPPKALARLGLTFANNIQDLLKQNQLVATDDSQQLKWFATPRRLAVWIPSVANKQPDQNIERRGPALQAAIDGQGQPTKAALGFARSCEVDFTELEKMATDKGEWLVHRRKQRGLSATKVIPSIIEEALKRLPVPKRMRWGDADAEFVRPVHWLVILHGDKSIKANLFGINSDNKTQGHRFHCNGVLPIDRADNYESILLDKGFVLPGFEQRRQLIVSQLKKLEAKTKGQIVIDDSLLDEVTGLVEWPNSLLGNFDEKFLHVPQEALVSSMRDHQKYFHVVDEKGALKPFFVTVSNIKSRSPTRVREGNERVLRSRLSDALFFWGGDKMQSLQSREEILKGVLFHQKLGSVFNKSERMQAAVECIVQQLGNSTENDQQLCKRSAQLAKLDLVTDMVGEFPELQGIMGHYYALNDGENPSVAKAVEDHYKPRFAGDTLPDDLVSQIVAIADKVDTLVGIFGAGEEPSGDKDPYALRRAALGVLRIVIETPLDLDLYTIYQHAAGCYKAQNIAIDDDAGQKAFAFTMDRLRAYYNDDYQADELASVTALKLNRPMDFAIRLAAVRDFKQLPAAQNLAAANKRIANILKKVEAGQLGDITPALLTEPAERALVDTLIDISARVAPLVKTSRYGEALTSMAELQQPIDRFFDDVMVMADDRHLRDNRISLLNHIAKLFLSVADISKLQIE